MISDITNGFYTITCCHSRTKKQYIVWSLSSCLKHTYHRGLFQNPHHLVLYRRYYTTAMNNQCNHKPPWTLIDTKQFYHFHITHAAHTMGLPDIWCQQNPLQDSLKSSYPLESMHLGMLQGCQNWPRCVLHVHQQWVWKIKPPKILWAMRWFIHPLSTFFVY